MQQEKTARVVWGGASLKAFAAFVTLVLALTLAPFAPAQAFADSGLSVSLAAGTHQGYGKTSFDVLTGKSVTLYAQVQDVVKDGAVIVKDGYIEDSTAVTEADINDFAIKWYKDSVADENLIENETDYLGWNSYYERPKWTTDLDCGTVAFEAAGTYKYYAVAEWALDGYETAVSEPLEFTITVTDPVVSDIVGVANPQEGGTFTFKVDGEEVTQAKTGDSVEVVATPAEGYVLSGDIVVKDANGEDVDYSSYWHDFTMPATAVTVTATFVKVVTSDIAVEVTGDGTAVCTVDGAEVTQAKTGDKVRISATPGDGFEIGSISVVDAEGTSVAVSSRAFTMPSSKVTVTVAFRELPKFTVSKAADMDTTHGDISFQQETFVAGGHVDMVIAPAEGYEIDEITFYDADGTTEISTKYFNKEWGYNLGCTVASDGLSAYLDIANYWASSHTDLIVKATFKEALQKYDIELAELGSGVNSVSFKVDAKDATKAAEGAEVTIYPVVGYGFDLDAVSVVDENGQEIETTLGSYSYNGGKYYFTMPASKVTVTVTAVAPTYSVVVSDAIANGAITVAEGSASTFTAADFDGDEYTVKFDVVPAAGYKLDEDSFRVVDEDGYECDYWSGVSWDAAAGTVTFSDYVFDGSARTFALEAGFVLMSAEEVDALVGGLEENDSNSEAVAAAQAANEVLKDAEIKLGEAEQSLESLEAEKAAVEAQLADAEAGKAAAEEALAAKEAELAGLQAQKEEVEAQLETAKTGLAALEAEKAEIETKLTEVEGAKKEAEDKLAEAQVSIDSLTAEKQRAEENLAKAQSDLKAAQEELAKAQEAKAAAEEELGKAQAAKEAAEKELNKTKADLEEAKKASENASGKSDNPMTVSGKTIKAKKAKKTKAKMAKVFNVKNAKGALAFAKLKGNSKITVKSNGTVVVKKGLKKNKTYKVKVLVVDAGNSKFAAASRIVTFKVKVK